MLREAGLDYAPRDLAYLQTEIFPRSFADLMTLIGRMTPMVVYKQHCRAYLQVETPGQDDEPFIQRWVFHTLTNKGFKTEGEGATGSLSEAEACDAFWRNFCAYVATPGRIVWRRLPEIDSVKDVVTKTTLYHIMCRLTLVPENVPMPIEDPTDAA